MDNFTNIPEPSPSTPSAAAPNAKQFLGSFACPTSEAQIFIKEGCVQDYVNARASQLASLLSLLYGECGQDFRNRNDDIQDNVLWLASNLADELREALTLVPFIGRDGVAK